jgi:hypothetical protein
MGNHIMEHCKIQVNLVSPRVSEVAITEIKRQPIGIEVIQLLDDVIPTTGVETIVAPITNFVKGGVLIGSSKNLGHGLGGVSTGTNLNRSLELPITIRVVGTP